VVPDPTRYRPSICVPPPPMENAFWRRPKRTPRHRDHGAFGNSSPEKTCSPETRPRFVSVITAVHKMRTLDRKIRPEEDLPLVPPVTTTRKNQFHKHHQIVNLTKRGTRTAAVLRCTFSNTPSEKTVVVKNEQWPRQSHLPFCPATPIEKPS